jgi:hypothetical protein
LDTARPHALPMGAARSAPWARGVLHITLYLVILSSFYTVVQPSPYEFLIAPLLLACLFARVPINIKLMPLVLLLLVLEAGGLASLVPVLDDSVSRDFMIISVYLALTAVVFACIFSEDSVRRLSIVRSAYVLSAVIATLLGIVAYFDFLPGSDQFLRHGRILSTFKDPNIYGPFLILPLLMLIERFIAGTIRVRHVIAAVILLVGLLLSYSRASWGNFALSTGVMLALLFITAPNRRARTHLIWLSLTAVVGVVVLFFALYSIDGVREMFEQRAVLLQEYDTGTSGARFSIQAKSIEEFLQHPNGMGPWVFGRTYGLVEHNSYFGTMLNHGWIGGIAYLGIVLTTLVVGFRASLIRTPWQHFLIVTYAAFVGLALVASLLHNTDHWRYYYLMLGIIWGLVAATENARRRALLQRSGSTLPSPQALRAL